MSKLILGTAEFNPLGYGGKPPIEMSIIQSIISLAKEAGIGAIDTADSYNCQDVINRYAKGFCIYTKTRDWKVQLNWGENELRGILYHYKQIEAPVTLPFIHRWINLGVSVYTPSQLPENKQRYIQIPFNINNTDKFKSCFDVYRTVFVRSIFDNGNLLKQYSVKECLNFVKQYRPDGIIVGVHSVKELEDILNVY